MDLNVVLSIHSILIEKFGGTEGVRNMELLQSAIERAHATFDGKELYPTTASKASALLESIVKNHPFIDGNKRTGYTLMRLLLLENKLDIDASQEAKYNFVISIASGKLNVEGIEAWIEKHLIKL
jgi:death on curing protein